MVNKLGRVARAPGRRGVEPDRSALRALPDAILVCATAMPMAAVPPFEIIPAGAAARPPTRDYDDYLFGLRCSAYVTEMTELQQLGVSDATVQATLRDLKIVAQNAAEREAALKKNRGRLSRLASFTKALIEAHTIADDQQLAHVPAPCQFVATAEQLHPLQGAPSTGGSWHGSAAAGSCHPSTPAGGHPPRPTASTGVHASQPLLLSAQQPTSSMPPANLMRLAELSAGEFPLPALPLSPREIVEQVQILKQTEIAVEQLNREIEELPQLEANAKAQIVEHALAKARRGALV